MAQDSYNFKPSVDIAGIASLMQKKALAEQEQKNFDRQQKLKEIEAAVSIGATFAKGAVEASKLRQQSQAASAISQAFYTPGTPGTPAGPPVEQSIPTPIGINEGPPSQSSGAYPGGAQIPAVQGVPQADGSVLPQTPAVAPGAPQPNATSDAILGAAKANPDAVTKAYADMLLGTPKTKYQQIQKQDGTLGLVAIDEKNQTFREIKGLTPAGTNANDRKFVQESGRISANAKSQIASTMGGKAVEAAVDPTKLRDYDRLTAGNRLEQFIQQFGNSATRQQVVEASTMLASMLTGGGRGSVVAEGLVNQLTPSTLKGTAMEKLQWFTNHPENADQGKFLKLFQITGQRESRVAQNNLRQNQIQNLQALYKQGTLTLPEYKAQLSNIGLSMKNVGPNGGYIHTDDVRPILPDFNPQAAGASSAEDEADQFLQGF